MATRQKGSGGGRLGEPIMDRSRSFRCVMAAVVSLAMAACGEGTSPDPSGPPGSTSQSGSSDPFDLFDVPGDSGWHSDKDGAMAGMLVCDVNLPPALQLPALVRDLEVDRAYQADRTGFIHQWVSMGPRVSGGPW